MIKSIMLACLALLIMFNTAPSGVTEALSANTEEAVSEAEDEALYRDDNITVTMDYLLTAGTTVKAGFLVSCPENRSCIVIPNFSMAVAEEEVFQTLKAIKEIGNGNIAQECKSGESTLCEFVWDVNETYDYSFLSMIPAEDAKLQLKEASAQLTTGAFPATAGFTLLECNGDVRANSDALFSGLIHDPDIAQVFLGTVSLKITSKE